MTKPKNPNNLLALIKGKYLVLLTIIGVALCAFLIHSMTKAEISVVLLPTEAQRDSGWVIYKVDPDSGAYWLHAKDTLYKEVTQDMSWVFSGEEGVYQFNIKTGTKTNGEPPISLIVDGKTVWEGLQPLFQPNGKLWCCAGSRQDGLCKAAPESQLRAAPQEGITSHWFTTQEVELKPGSSISFSGTTVYPCSDFLGKPPRSGQGGGAYPILFEIRAVKM